jgi:flagellar motor switch protein FliM
MDANKQGHREAVDLREAIALGNVELPDRSQPAVVEAVVRRYDFKGPPAVDPGLLPALHGLHLAFVGEFAAGIATLARSAVDVKLLGVDQLSVRDFLARLDNPTCLSVLHAEPLPESWIVDIQPAVFYPIIDCMLGGGELGGGPATRRAPSEIEIRLAGRIAEMLCEKLRRAWHDVADLRPKLLRIETRPRSVRTVSCDDGALVVRFGISLGQRHGLMRLCLPRRTLEPIRDRLSTVGSEWGPGRPPLPENVQRIGREVCGTKTEVEVCLAESTISARDLIGLRVGDIITTSKDIRSPVVVEVSGVPKFHARPGAVRGRKAVVIIEPLATPASRRVDDRRA